MNAGKARGHHRKPDSDRSDVDGANVKTPATDMQAEDAGTFESGNSGKGTASESAMKQFSKTDSENARDNKRSRNR